MSPGVIVTNAQANWQLADIEVSGPIVFSQMLRLGYAT